MHDRLGITGEQGFCMGAGNTMKKDSNNRWIVDLVIEMVKAGAKYAAGHAEEIAAGFQGGKKRGKTKPGETALARKLGQAGKKIS